MGMGNYADYADTVTPEFVKKMAPKEYDDFMTFLDEIDLSFDDFGRGYQDDYFDGIGKEDTKKAIRLFGALTRAFDKATVVGNHSLNLSIAYHDEEDTDRGNDLYGAAWSVEPYILSPAGRKFEKEIHRLTWTNYG